jgi:hypothetical protein
VGLEVGPERIGERLLERPLSSCTFSGSPVTLARVSISPMSVVAMRFTCVSRFGRRSVSPLRTASRISFSTWSSSVWPKTVAIVTPIGTTAFTLSTASSGASTCPKLSISPMSGWPMPKPPKSASGSSALSE